MVWRKSSPIFRRKLKLEVRRDFPLSLKTKFDAAMISRNLQMGRF